MGSPNHKSTPGSPPPEPGCPSYWLLACWVTEGCPFCICHQGLMSQPRTDLPERERHKPHGPILQEAFQFPMSGTASPSSRPPEDSLSLALGTSSAHLCLPGDAEYLGAEPKSQMTPASCHLVTLAPRIERRAK